MSVSLDTTSYDGSPKTRASLAAQVIGRLAMRHAELTCVCDGLRVQIAEGGKTGAGHTECVLDGMLRLNPQRSETNPTMSASGRLEGSFAGAPLSIEADEQTLLVKTSAALKTVRSANRSRQAIKPLLEALATAGIEVKMKFGVLPAVRVT